MKLRPSLVLVVVLSLSSARALAGGTRSFVLDSANVLEEGKLEGTTVRSDGSIARGVTTRRTALTGVASAKSLLVAPDDVRGLARSLDRLLLDRAFAAQLGAAARRTIVETLDIHHLLDREVALLRAVAEGAK